MLKITRITAFLVVILTIVLSPGRNAHAQERTIKSKYSFSTPELDAAQKLYSGRKYPEALAAFQSIIDNANANSNWEELIYTMEKKALALRRLERYDEAIQTMDKAVTLALERLPKGHFLVSKMYYTRGTTDHSLRDYYNARAFLDTALVFYSNSSTYDSSAYYRMIEYKYYAYQYSEGSSDTLLKYLNELVKLEEGRQTEVKRPDRMLSLLQGYPTIYLQKGDFEQALSYAIKGYKFARDNRDKVSNRYYAEAQFFLARVLFNKGNFAKTLEVGLAAMPIVESTPRGAMPEYYAFNNLIGITLMALRDYDEALVYLEKAAKVPLNVKDVSKKRQNILFYTRLMINIGLCYDNLEDTEKARFYLESSLEEMKKIMPIPSPNLHSNYEQLGDFYSRHDNVDDALLSYDSALRNGLASYTGSILEFPEQKEDITFSYRDLRTLRKKAKALKDVALGDRESEEILLSSLEFVELTHGLLMKSRDDLIDSEGKLFFSQNFKTLYETGIEVCFELYSLTGEPDFFDKALSFAKLSKAILFLEQSQEFDIVNTEFLSLGVKEYFFRTKSKVEALQSKFDELVDKSPTSDSLIAVNELLLSAKKENEFIKDSITSLLSNELTRESSFNDIFSKSPKTLIPENQALIEYFYGQGNIYILGKSSEATSFRKVILDNEFEEALQKTINLVSSPPDIENIDRQFISFRENSSILFNSLLNPTLEDLGASVDHLVIIPDEFLSRLPFEVLVAGDNSSVEGFRGLNYLVKSKSIQYELSSELFNSQPTGIQGKGELLGVGYLQEGTTDTRSGLGSLPGTEREIQYLKSTVNGTYLVGAAGRKRDFLLKAKDFEILHLAIHGKADSINRYNSSLIFNGSGDNVLNTNDLYLADLRARLAVLSACESGVGVLNQGEGTFSIARGFALVGVPSVVMSLWKVNDQTTSKLMVEMYKEFIDEGKPINSALRATKLSYLETGDAYSSHPYYWAAFLQLGENVELESEGNFYLGFLILAFSLLILMAFLFYYQKRKRAN